MEDQKIIPGSFVGNNGKRLFLSELVDNKKLLVAIFIMTRETLVENEAQTKGSWITEDVSEYLDPTVSEAKRPLDSGESANSPYCSGRFKYDLPFVTERDL